MGKDFLADREEATLESLREGLPSHQVLGRRVLRLRHIENTQVNHKWFSIKTVNHCGADIVVDTEDQIVFPRRTVHSAAECLQYASSSRCDCERRQAFPRRIERRFFAVCSKIFAHFGVDGESSGTTLCGLYSRRGVMYVMDLQRMNASMWQHVMQSNAAEPLDVQ